MSCATPSLDHYYKGQVHTYRSNVNIIIFVFQPHEDGPLYYPTVSTISLGSHTLLDFYRPIIDTQSDDNTNIDLEVLVFFG
jgi:hypothetical protein